MYLADATRDTIEPNQARRKPKAPNLPNATTDRHGICLSLIFPNSGINPKTHSKTKT